MRLWTLLVCFAMVAGLVACQDEGLSDRDINRIADRLHRLQDQPLLDDSSAKRLAEAFLEHPRYLAYLEDGESEVVKAFTDAILEHPAYQTTPEEDCVNLILMAAVMAGDYSLPPDSEIDRMCEWYQRQTEGGRQP